MGLLGGTGREGQALALRFAHAGVPVIMGSRSSDRAREIASSLCRRLGHDLISGLENREMIRNSDLIFLTVPFPEAAGAIEVYADSFQEGSILVDTTVPVAFEKGQPKYNELPEGSASEFLAGRLPAKIALAGAFKTIPTHLLGDLTVPLACDVFVYSDFDQARERVMAFAGLIPDLRPINAGGLSAARTVERMTVLAIGINRRYKIKTARFRVIGL